ncbi:hypothetical protein ACK3SF_04600 [Candidatus Nanosalina sp. VS9-1]|uniref:hypothetical protein n=1 Tax=Candidatus Nanosalina sp. VS9-1 TaxID=3388566 RepID=UPI0039E159FD
MSFLLNFMDKLKENEDEEDGPKFNDMNYLVGNTTGMDVGQEPGPLAQRIGSTAQKGGEVLEVLLQNPATFQVDREDILNVVGQLGVDVTFHGNTDLGYGAAYATRAQGVQAGYNVVHRYFTRYLDQLASFKKQVEDEYGFSVGYVNMHASTEQIPPLEEQIASDKSLDPFGQSITEVKDNKEPNIYRNKEFMELLFDYLIAENIEPIQLYGMFGEYSDWFEKEWRDARDEVANDLYAERLSGDIRGKASLVETGAGIDQGISLIYREKIGEKELERPVDLSHRPVNTEDPESVAVLETAIQAYAGRTPNVRQLAENVYEIQNDEGLSENDRKVILSAINSVMNKLWTGNGNDKGLSFQAKVSALTNRLDIQQQDIADEADTDAMREKAKKVFSGYEKAYEEYTDESGEEKYLELFHRLIDRTQIGRQMEKESTVFYNIIPAWLTVADKEYENHPSFEAPKFIWETIVENNYDLDFSEYSEVKERLDSDREFRLDITAAVAATYLWGQFTQREDTFDGDKNTGLEPEENMTWIQWMNKHGLKTNIEAMYGDPGNLLRLWRPKDIAVACRAVNLTARNESEEWEGEYRGNPLKFTVDLEHTASFGVDPEVELQKLVDQEKALAEDERFDIDKEKPLADILKTYHLTKPGFEQQGIHRHGPFMRGDTVLYRYLYMMVDAGFCRNDGEDSEGIVMFEIGGEYAETLYTTRIAMDLIELGVEPDDLDPVKVPDDGEYENRKQALIARFFGLDQSSTNMEWTKIEEHAFDPLQGLLEAESFDHTYSGRAATDSGTRPGEWLNEQYR